MRNLAKGLEKTSSLRQRVDIGFLVDEIFRWLQRALEEGPSEPLVAYLSKCCESAIQEYEIDCPTPTDNLPEFEKTEHDWLKA